MTEDLMSGYAAFTSADEYGAATVGAAPGTTPASAVASLVIASPAVIVSYTVLKHC